MKAEAGANRAKTGATKTDPVVFFTAPFSNQSRIVHEALQGAVTAVGGTLYYPGDHFGPVDSFLRQIHDSAVIVCDVSTRNPNVMYELGFAEALAKPTILLSRSLHDAPFDISTHRFLLYESFKTSESLKPVLIELLNAALTQPAVESASLGPRGRRVFISYSHQDRPFLDRLMIHLRPLQKQGLMDVWADTRISPGKKWKEEISGALDSAAVAVLLISADFLASDFIVDDELPPLLKSAEEQGTVILPLIIKPCRFVRDPHLKDFQAINDPKRSMITLREDEQEGLYDATAEAIEKVLLLAK